MSGRLPSLLLLLVIHAIVGCDDASSTGSPLATPGESAPVLQPRASWILSDTGRFSRSGKLMTVSTRQIPHWHCEGSVRVRDTARKIMRIELDSKGRPASMVDRDTLPGGSVVVSASSFFLVDTVWAIRTRDSVVKNVAADSIAIRVRRKLVETRVLELTEKTSRARIHLAGWDYAPAWVAGLADLPSHVGASVPSENQGRLQNRSTGEVVSARFRPSLGEPLIDWSSSRSVRTPATTGGVPATCPTASRPDWLDAFFGGI
jgi:hypothetical protein